MRKFPGIASALVMSALVVSCSDQTTSPAVDSPDFRAAGPVTHRASVGGADICDATGQPTGCDANYSLIALGYADGTASGQWQDTFRTGGGEGIHVAVDCLNVDGNEAVIGGVITKGTLNGQDFSGRRVLTALVDNGTSANDAEDEISFTFLTGNPDPSLCNALSVDVFRTFDAVVALVKGQAVVVQ